MLGLLIMFSFWIAITLIIAIPFILVITIGTFVAEKLQLKGAVYVLFMVLLYAIIVCLLVMI